MNGISRLLVDYLAHNGFEAVAARDGREMWQALERHVVDLVVLDLMLRDTDGLTLCRDQRAKSNMPVLMLTASWASRWAPMIIWSNPSIHASCSPASNRSCVAPVRCHPICVRNWPAVCVLPAGAWTRQRAC